MASTRPIALVSSDSPLEPGVFGILRPVLLWPRRIGERLGDAQVEAILAHELSHVRRRDNLAAALHMVVEALFWFHPLVWWMGARLVDERERACDEEVIRLGSEPQVYAESILKTCELYVESRLVCVAGVTGSDLKQRIEAIMSDDARRALSGWRMLLLAAAGAAVDRRAGAAVGALNAPRARARRRHRPRQRAGPSFEVASIKPNKSGDGASRDADGTWRTIHGHEHHPGDADSTGLSPAGSPLRGLGQRLPDLGAPAWVYSDRFDIVAKADASAPANQIVRR